MMKYLKKYNKFFEDGVASVNASTTGGAGGVSNAVVGSLPGIPAGSGSGDATFTLGGVATKQPIVGFLDASTKKGDASEVSDARYLEPVETNKVEDIKEEE